MCVVFLVFFLFQVIIDCFGQCVLCIVIVEFLDECVVQVLGFYVIYFVGDVGWGVEVLQCVVVVDLGGVGGVVGVVWLCQVFQYFLVFDVGFICVWGGVGCGLVQVVVGIGYVGLVMFVVVDVQVEFGGGYVMVDEGFDGVVVVVQFLVVGGWIIW